jgi:hypothetical protein
MPKIMSTLVASLIMDTTTAPKISFTYLVIPGKVFLLSQHVFLFGNPYVIITRNLEFRAESW